MLGSSLGKELRYISIYILAYIPIRHGLCTVEGIYLMDKLKLGFVLSYMNEKEAKDWRELYLESIEDPAIGKLVYPTFSTFLTEVCKAFWSADQVQDAICKLESLKQGKKTAEQVITEFKQLIRQAGLTTRSTSDNIHLIGLF